MDNRRDWMGNYMCGVLSTLIGVYFKMVEHRKWGESGTNIGKFTIVFPKVLVFLVCCNTLINI